MRNNFALLVLMLLSMVVIGCKREEVSLYERGVKLYSDDGSRKNAIRLLRQSGNMGHWQSYVFLMDSESIDALQLLKMRTSHSFDEKLERVKEALSSYEKASEYLILAKGKGWTGFAKKEDEIETGINKCEVLLNVLNAEKIVDHVKKEEALPGTTDEMRKLSNMIESLERAVELYSKVIAVGEASYAGNVTSIKEWVAQLTSRLSCVELEGILKSAEEKIMLADQFELDPSASLKNNVNAAIKSLQYVKDAASLYLLAVSKCSTNDFEGLKKRIDWKQGELESYISKLSKEMLQEETERRQRAEEAQRREEDAKKEILRRQSAEYCLSKGACLTVGAMREIVASLNYRSNTGNEILDSQNEERERGRFKGMRAHIEGQIKRVDTGFWGGVNIWIISNGMSVKCGFGGMSKDVGARYLNGQKLRVIGTIDGTGGLMDDLSITNCSAE